MDENVLRGLSIALIIAFFLGIFTTQFAGHIKITGSAVYENEIVVSTAIENVADTPLDTTIELINETEYVIYSKTAKEHNFNAKKGKYKIKITPQNHLIKEITFNNVSLDVNVGKIVDIDDPSDNQGFNELYVVNPLLDESAVIENETSIEITLTASNTPGNRLLYKCAEWNWEAEVCEGSWVIWQAIEPGKEYTVVLNDFVDPALAEGNGTFFDGFESGSLATNNWVTSGAGTAWTVGDGESTPYAGTYNIRTENTDGESVIETDTNTTDYVNITFSFYAVTAGLDGGEYFAADWYDGTSWNNLLNIQDIASYTLYSYTLASNADNNSAVKIRFRCSSSANNEDCEVDNVQVTGNAPPDNVDPATTLNYPANNYYNDNSDPVNVAFNCSATDNKALANISFYITNNNNASFGLNQTNSLSGTTDSVEFTAELTNGNYTWNCLAYDTSDNFDWADNNRTLKINFTYVDITAPDVFSIVPTAGSDYGVNITIQIQTNVTDDVTVDTVLANITYPNTTVQQLNLSNIGGDRYSKDFDIPNLVGQYNVLFIANDTSNNINSTETTYFNASVIDVVDPITLVAPPDETVDIGTETTIQWTLQDNSGSGGYYYVKKDSVLFQGPAQWANNVPIIVRSDTHFFGTNYTIFYNDSSGNNGTPDTVFVYVVDNRTPSCDDLENGGSYPALTNITVDGNHSDWDAVLSNPENYVNDLSEGGGDLDSISTADRDLTTFAYTWDDQNIYFYFRRVSSGHNLVSTIVYLDYDNDGYMNSTDQVVKFVWSGSNQLYNSDLYNYVPAGAGGDLMNGSGYDMLGSITVNQSLETGVLGGVDPGIALETRVLWSDIGFAGPTPITFQGASAQGAGTNLPSQLEDNIEVRSSLFSRFLFKEDSTKGGANGTYVFHVHDLQNCGVLEETIDLTNISSQGWDVTFFHPNATVITDTNADGNPDVTLGVENYSIVVVRVEIPSAASSGTIDTTVVTASSNIDLGYNQSVTDKTVVGDIIVLPQSQTATGTQGMVVKLSYTAYNYQAFNDTLELNATSTQGWATSFYYPNGTLITDTDSDGNADLGNMLPGDSQEFILYVYIPGAAAINITDTTTIYVNSSAGPKSVTGNVITTVNPRLSIEPDYTRTVGIGDSTFYKLTIINSWNESDVIDISYNDTLGWSTVFYEQNKITLLADTDSDTIIDIGSLGPYGDQYVIYAKVTVPLTAGQNDSDIIAVYANSSLNTSVYDFALINTTAKVLVIYSDGTRTNESNVFTVNDTIYTRAYNLLGVNNVYFEWIDANATLVKTSIDIAVTSGDDADDLFATNESSLLGNWTVIVYDAQNDLELGRAIFLLQDNVPPKVTLNSPTDNFYNDISYPVNVTFNCSATDNRELSNISLYITDNNNASFGLYQTTSVSGKSNSSEWTLLLTKGNYTWNCLAYDTLGNLDWGDSNWSVKINATILNETTPPVIELINPANNSIDDNGYITFEYNVTDLETNVTYCELIIDGNVSANDTTITEGITQSFVEVLPDGEYNWSINCTNEYNLTGSSEQRALTVNITDIFANISCCCVLDISATPHFVTTEERVLISADVANLLKGESATPADISNVTASIYRIENGTASLILENASMTFIRDGLWYYEFEILNNGTGTYIASVVMATNQTPPFVRQASYTFTIGDAPGGGLTVQGVSPDLINANETTRLAAEIYYNSIPISAGQLANGQLEITEVNGTTNTYNTSGSLQLEDGILYLDGTFNTTGAYYLNWTIDYKNQTRSAKEVIVVVDWGNKIDNLNISINVSGELLTLIQESRGFLIELLSDMEQLQQFNEEEVFLVTDSVNSMTQVIEYLENGDITPEEAEKQFKDIQEKLRGTLGDFTGYSIKSKTSIVIDTMKDYLWIIIALVAITAVLVGNRFARTEVKTEGNERRYQILLKNIKKKLHGKKKEATKEKTAPKIKEIANNKPDAETKRRYQLMLEKIMGGKQPTAEKTEKNETVEEKEWLEPETESEKEKDLIETNVEEETTQKEEAEESKKIVVYSNKEEIIQKIKEAYENE